MGYGIYRLIRLSQRPCMCSCWRTCMINHLDLITIHDHFQRVPLIRALQLNLHLSIRLMWFTDESVKDVLKYLPANYEQELWRAQNDNCEGKLCDESVFSLFKSVFFNLFQSISLVYLNRSSFKKGLLITLIRASWPQAGIISSQACSKRKSSRGPNWGFKEN